MCAAPAPAPPLSPPLPRPESPPVAAPPDDDARVIHDRPLPLRRGSTWPAARPRTDADVPSERLVESPPADDASPAVASAAVAV